jgi:hypothetical protein
MASWPLLPAASTFLLLGLALAARPVTLVAAGVTSLVPCPLLAGTALSPWPVAVLAIVSALIGRWVARRLHLF